MANFIFFAVKKVENADTNEGPDGICDEIKPVSSASWDDGFLDDFGQPAVEDADDSGKPQGFFPIGFVVLDILFSIAPNTQESETHVHDDMSELVKAYDRFDSGEKRTRKSCQNQNDDSTQDSRETISG